MKSQFKCKKCGKKFEKRWEIRTHIAKHKRDADGCKYNKKDNKPMSTFYEKVVE